MATAAGKRVRISKMQQHMMLSVMGASVVLGLSMILTIYFVKTINFNSRVIEGKDLAMEHYETAIKNIGICRDDNGDGKFTDKELEECNPGDLDITTMPKTVRYNVLMNLANNMDLESVARPMLQGDCYKNENGRNVKINFSELYRKATTEKDRTEYLNMLTKCSAIRVVPDALPSKNNEEALLASINEIFIQTGIEPEGLSPAGSSAASRFRGVRAIPVSLRIEETDVMTHALLSNLEKSIREFDIDTATITWSGSGAEGTSMLELRGQANAYYITPKNVAESKRKMYASDAAKGL